MTEQFQREISHSLKGSERKDHKYLSRKWSNGHWVYEYADTGHSSKKSRQLDLISRNRADDASEHQRLARDSRDAKFRATSKIDGMHSYPANGTGYNKAIKDSIKKRETVPASEAKKLRENIKTTADNRNQNTKQFEDAKRQSLSALNAAQNKRKPIKISQDTLKLAVSNLKVHAEHKINVGKAILSKYANKTVSELKSTSKEVKDAINEIKTKPLGGDKGKKSDMTLDNGHVNVTFGDVKLDKMSNSSVNDSKNAGQKKNNQENFKAPNNANVKPRVKQVEKSKTAGQYSPSGKYETQKGIQAVSKKYGSALASKVAKFMDQSKYDYDPMRVAQIIGDNPGAPKEYIEAMYWNK